MMVERRKKTFNIISKRFLESIIDDVSSIHVGVLDNSIDIYSLKAEIKLGLIYAFKLAASKFKRMRYILEYRRALLVRRIPAYL